jgi:hypothetical protein
MSNSSTEKNKFQIGTPIPYHGLEGETLIVSGKHVAALSSAVAVWHADSALHHVELPYVEVNHARWSKDRTKIFVGTGAVNTIFKQWEAQAQLSHLQNSPPPGRGGLAIKSTAWSEDGQFVAVLMDWSGPRDGRVVPPQVILFDLSAENPPVCLPITQAEDVQIFGNRVIVATYEVSIWSFKGVEIARLPATQFAPAGMSSYTGEGYFMLMDHDWTVRIVDPKNWTIKARWKGYFRDIISTASGIIALDTDGNLHAACLTDKGVQEIGTARTGLLASKLVVSDENHLMTMGAGPVAVHSISYELICPR